MISQGEGALEGIWDVFAGGEVSKASLAIFMCPPQVNRLK